MAAAQRFAAAGGTHLFLATQNYTPGPPVTLEEYAQQFETTATMAERVRGVAGVTAYLVVAPYPVDLIGAAQRLGVPAALDLHLRAIDLAGRWVRERRAVALGEVGRAHFDVPPELGEAIDVAFRHAMKVAGECGCPVVVHSADLDPAGFRGLARIASEEGLPPERVVKHYARAHWPVADRAGIVPSYLARRELVSSVVSDPAPWFLETDFLDDPRRPGAVLDLATVPRRARAISDQHPEDPDRLFVPFVESVERVYGWRPELGREGTGS